VAEVRGRSAKLSVVVARAAEEKLASCSIEDNGCGIPREKLSALFEPYYTTKPADRGTGLGLFVVKQIVESSGGAVSVASTLGSGTASPSGCRWLEGSFHSPSWRAASRAMSRLAPPTWPDARSIGQGTSMKRPI